MSESLTFSLGHKRFLSGSNDTPQKFGILNHERKLDPKAMRRGNLTICQTSGNKRHHLLLPFG